MRQWRENPREYNVDAALACVERSSPIEFFEQFDELCGLANDGDGRSDKEKLKVLLSRHL